MTEFTVTVDRLIPCNEHVMQAEHISAMHQAVNYPVVEYRVITDYGQEISDSQCLACLGKANSAGGEMAQRVFDAYCTFLIDSNETK